MFIFTKIIPGDLSDKKWKLFISDLYKSFNKDIDLLLFESVIIQQIYSSFFTNKTYYNFNYNIQPINITDIHFWKVCTLEYDNTTYLYHKLTNIIFKKHEDKYYFIGFLSNNDILYHQNINNSIINNWLLSSGFFIN